MVKLDDLVVLVGELATEAELYHLYTTKRHQSPIAAMLHQLYPPSIYETAELLKLLAVTQGKLSDVEARLRPSAPQAAAPAQPRARGRRRRAGGSAASPRTRARSS